LKSRNRKRKNLGGPPRGNLNRLCRLQGFAGFDLASTEGLRGIIAEATRQHLANKISYRQLSAVTSAVQLLMKDRDSGSSARTTKESPTVSDNQPETLIASENQPNSLMTVENADPIPWLESNLAFHPFEYQAVILRDHGIKTRVVRKSRQIGITTALAMESTWKAFTQPARTILIISPSDRQSKILMRRIQDGVDANPSLCEQVTRKNTTELWLKNGSSIISLPNNPDRIRGFSATDIIADEAAQFLNDEKVLASIRPMLAATNGSFTVVSTPKGKRGLFYDEYRRAVSEQSKRTDIKAYDLYPSSICPLITSEFLENERGGMSDLQYSEEYEGAFVEVADTYITMPTIMGCVDKGLQLLTQGAESASYLIGLDLAKQRDETVVILLERVDDVLTVRYIEAWSKMDYTDQIGRLRLLAERFRIGGGCVDQTGVGQPIVEDLKGFIPGIQGINFTQESKVDMAAGLLTVLEQHKILLPDNKKLIMQLNGLRYRVSKNGATLFESPEKARLHDDYLWALALAVYAARMDAQVDRQRPFVIAKQDFGFQGRPFEPSYASIQP